MIRGRIAPWKEEKVKTKKKKKTDKSKQLFRAGACRASLPAVEAATAPTNAVSRHNTAKPPQAFQLAGKRLRLPRTFSSQLSYRRLCLGALQGCPPAAVRRNVQSCSRRLSKSRASSNLRTPMTQPCVATISSSLRELRTATVLSCAAMALFAPDGESSKAMHWLADNPSFRRPSRYGSGDGLASLHSMPITTCFAKRPKRPSIVRVCIASSRGALVTTIVFSELESHHCKNASRPSKRCIESDVNLRYSSSFCTQTCGPAACRTRMSSSSTENQRPALQSSGTSCAPVVAARGKDPAAPWAR
eukprot:scaffold1462_cov260-Pinguiococcus_pyrenoidosus.AAC.9